MGTLASKRLSTTLTLTSEREISVRNEIILWKLRTVTKLEIGSSSAYNAVFTVVLAGLQVRIPPPGIQMCPFASHTSAHVFTCRVCVSHAINHDEV
jgi:hypothetical protein